MNLTRLWFDARVRVALMTLLCFLLTSTGWLMWLYHLTGIASPTSVDVFTMVIGYLMQAAGIGCLIVVRRRDDPEQARRGCVLAVVAYLACLLPAVLAPNLGATLAFGYLANIACGYLQGHYLLCLARDVDASWRGRVFGCAYALSTALGGLLSLAPGNVLTQGVGGLVTCAVLALPTAALMYAAPAGARDDGAEADPSAQPATNVAAGTLGPASRPVADEQTGWGLLPLACACVFLMSLTKSTGYGFPTVDLLETVDIELSRLLYGVGLVVAGYICDRSRRYGALCCAGALVTPFLMLALSGAEAPATLLWALGYLLFGFFSVYRVALLADLASDMGHPRLSGLGLLSGRAGDALGTALSIALAAVPLALITVSAVLFACAMLALFVLAQRVYATIPEVRAPSKEEVFERFASSHDLSAREREVLRLVLDERSNSEIAGELVVSEATVKFHVRNILKKTGCKNRMKVLQLYAEEAHEA